MPEPMIRRPGDDAAIANPVGGQITFKVRGEQTDGRLVVLETIAAPGDGPPLHTHAGEDEGLLVVQGEVRFRLREEIEMAPVGSFVYVPRGTPHTWQNIGDRPARMLVLFTPAGMERFFDAFAADIARGPPGEPTGIGRLCGGPPVWRSDPRRGRRSRSASPEQPGYTNRLTNSSALSAHVAPAAVDRQRVTAALDLDDFGHGRRCGCSRLNDALATGVRNRVVLLARHDQHRAAFGVLGVDLVLGPRVQVRASRPGTGPCRGLQPSTSRRALLASSSSRHVREPVA